MVLAQLQIRLEVREFEETRMQVSIELHSDDGPVVARSNMLGWPTELQPVPGMTVTFPDVSTLSKTGTLKSVDVDLVLKKVTMHLTQS